MAVIKFVIECEALKEELWVYFNRPQANEWTLCSPYLLVQGGEGTTEFSEKARTGNNTYFFYKKGKKPDLKEAFFYLENFKPTNSHRCKDGMQGFGRFIKPPPRWPNAGTRSCGSR